MTMTNTSIPARVSPMSVCCSCGAEMHLPRDFTSYPLCNSCASLLMKSCTSESPDRPDLDLLRQRIGNSPLFAAWFLHAAELVLDDTRLDGAEREALVQEMKAVRRRYGPALYPVLYHLGQHMQNWDRLYDAICCYNLLKRGVRILCYKQYHDPSEYEGLLAKTNWALTALIGDEDLDVWDDSVVYAQADLIRAKQFLSETKCRNGTTEDSHRSAMGYLARQYEQLAEKLSNHRSLQRKLEHHIAALKEYSNKISEDGKGTVGFGLNQERGLTQFLP